MKKYIQMFTLLFLTVLLISCDDESMDNPIQQSSDLIAIQETLNAASTTDYTINNNLNTQIDYGSGSYQIQIFTDGKMTSIEYFNNGVASGNATYIYDSNDRLINSTKFFFADNQSYEQNYEYLGNQVIGTSSSIGNDGLIISESTYTFTLNDNNQIVHYQNEENTAFWDASYTNGNLTGFSASGYGDDTDGSATFIYSIDLASEPYQKERYRYGSEWRNNIMLSQTGTYAFKQLAELGQNYLTGYTYVVTSDPTRTITLSVNYEFDSLGRLTKQTKDKMFFETSLDRELTYQYE